MCMIVGRYLLALGFSVYFGCICLGEFVFTDHTFPALLFYELIRCCISKRPATSLVASLLISDKDHISFVDY